MVFIAESEREMVEAFEKQARLARAAKREEEEHRRDEEWDAGTARLTAEIKRQHRRQLALQAVTVVKTAAVGWTWSGVPWS